MYDLSYFILISSLSFDLEEIEEEAPGEESGEASEEESVEAAEEESEEQLEEEPGEHHQEVSYTTTLSENNISQIDINKNTIDIFLIAAVLGSVLGFIFLQRIKSVWV